MNRGWLHSTSRTFLTLLVLAFTAFAGTAQAQDQQQDGRYYSDLQIWKLIIRASIASSSQLCPCP